MDEEVAVAGGGGPGGIVEGLGEVDVVGVELVAALDDDRLEDLKRKFKLLTFILSKKNQNGKNLGLLVV